MSAAARLGAGRTCLNFSHPYYKEGTKVTVSAETEKTIAGQSHSPSCKGPGGRGMAPLSLLLEGHHGQCQEVELQRRGLRLPRMPSPVASVPVTEPPMNDPAPRGRHRATNVVSTLWLELNLHWGGDSAAFCQFSPGSSAARATSPLRQLKKQPEAMF